MMGKARLAVAVTGVLAFGVLAGCGGGDDGGSTPTENSGSSSGGGTDPAVTLFNSEGCAGCHTLGVADASGAVGPNLDVTTLTKSQIEAQIRSGGGAMPAYEDQLSDAQIGSLATLISSQ